MEYAVACSLVADCARGERGVGGDGPDEPVGTGYHVLKLGRMIADLAEALK